MATIVLSGPDVPNLSWLPMGWGVGLKTLQDGTHILHYTSPPPESESFVRKADAEKFLNQVEESRKRKASVSTECPTDPDQLFGKLHTYEECCLAVEVPRRPVVRPSNWPTDTVHHHVAPPRWLPEGWRLGLKASRLCYVSPDGIKFFHKTDIEDFVGCKLEAPLDEGLSLSYPLSLRSTPKWPDGDWLPRDWRVAYRRLPTSLHRIYVPPSQSAGYLYTPMCVEKYLKDGSSTRLVSFDDALLLKEVLRIDVQKRLKQGV